MSTYRLGSTEGSVTMRYNKEIAVDYSSFYGVAVFAALMALVALMLPPMVIMPFLGKVVAGVAVAAAACATGFGVRVHLNAIAFKHEEMMRQADEFVGLLPWIKASDNPELNEDLRRYALVSSTLQLASCNEVIEE